MALKKRVAETKRAPAPSKDRGQRPSKAKAARATAESGVPRSELKGTASKTPAKSSVQEAPGDAAPNGKRDRKYPPSDPSLPAEAVSAGDLVDRQLEKYRSMRNFGVTAEPSGEHESGGEPAQGSLPFCIQKHAASHLHYDFRLGWNGVLKSWAVAKGPSYVTADKRLAVQVEDHPIEYGGFEGIIPKGQYGGGTVMLWDEGTWSPQAGHEDVDAGLRDGNLKFLLFGSKMRGKWALIRMGGRFAQERKPNWLLIKEHDSSEQTAYDVPVTEAEPRSVTTGRTLEEISSNQDHVWNSKETASKQGRAWFRQETASDAQAGIATPPRSKLPPAALAILHETPEEPQPEFIKPQLAEETAQPPEGNGWLHELKLDGYRMQARKSARGVEMLTRSGLDWTYRVPSVAAAVARLPVGAATLDGEVVVLREDGTTNFADLQASFQEGKHNPLTFFCFDLLHLQGRNLRGLPLRRRKELLTTVLATSAGHEVRLSEHLETGGGELFRHACELHAEGILSKSALSPYRSGRSRDWLKSKCLHEQEFVIGGFTLPSNGSHGVGALLLGYYREDQLIYAGRTGTGFTQKTHRLLRDRLDMLRVKPRTFAKLPPGAGRAVIWAKPQLVAQVRFSTWTADDLVRHAAFLGLREDKTAREVSREAIQTPPRPKHAKSRTPETGIAQDRTSVAQTASRTKQVLERPAIRLTHPGKILDRESGVTKQALADYYWDVSRSMLPGIAGRPLSLVRCPEGSEKPCFYQKHVNHLLPAGVSAVEVPDKRTGITEPYITLSAPEALAGLAQMGVLEVHPWGSCNQNLEYPDRIIFDLDPDEALPWPVVTEAARTIYDRLRSIKLESFVKTTGGKGLHIVAPIAPELEWSKLKDIARAFVVEMEREHPQLYLTKMTKAARKGRIYLDYLRNERGATAVAAYSPRARAGLPVSVPLTWEELRGDERPRFTVGSFATWKDRLQRDPWKRLATLKQRLDL